MAAARCSFCGRGRDEVPALVAGPGRVFICPECAELAVQIGLDSDKTPESPELLITGIGQLVTNRGADGDLLGIIEDAVVAVREGKVAWSGATPDLPFRFRDLPTLDCEGRAVVPGFVDAHTHMVFAGDRSGEFGRRRRGERYEDIARQGGGIRATVAATRAAGPDALLNEALQRAGRMLASGTTTVEVKSGYGLDPLTEVHLLEVALEIGERLPIDVVTSFLGAHAVPPEFDGLREAYLWTVEREMLPACAPLARYCDVFCDQGAFDVAESRRVLQAGLRLGLRPRLHANQLGDSGGVELAAEMGAVSADHLDHCNEEQAALLAEAGVVGVLLPAASLSLGTHPPAPMMWSQGVTVAVATDCNPGTANVERMPFVVALACLELGLTAEQALWAATRGGALALELGDRGGVWPGAAADMVILDADSHLHLAYRPDADHVWKVVKGGRAVVG